MRAHPVKLELLPYLFQTSCVGGITLALKWVEPPSTHLGGAETRPMGRRGTLPATKKAEVMGDKREKGGAIPFQFHSEC